MHTRLLSSLLAVTLASSGCASRTRIAAGGAMFAGGFIVGSIGEPEIGPSTQQLAGGGIVMLGALLFASGIMGLAAKPRPPAPAPRTDRYVFSPSSR